MGSSTYVAATTVSFLSLKFNPSVWNEIDTEQSLHTAVSLLLYDSWRSKFSGWDYRDSFLFVSMWWSGGSYMFTIGTVMGIKSAIIKDN